MKLAVLLFAIFTFASYVAAQDSPRGSQFDAAVEAFESGEYEQTIALLAAYEKSRGTSPRLESLRALAYRDLEKPKEAHQAILVYLRLTANREMSGSEAHQDMLKLRDEMLEAIEKKYKEDKEELDKERDEEADAIVAELESVYSSPQIKRSYSSALPASIKSEADDPPGEYIGPPPSASKAATPGMDALAELEMWRKISESTVAMDYFLFIETFPDGQFTEIARKKMLEVGDPAWNAVRNDHDPFKFRDFIKNNPDSPFLELAKARMEVHAKVALEWELVMDSTDFEARKAFEKRNDGHPLAARSRQIREDVKWRNIENVTNPGFFRDFLKEFPDSPRAPEARAKLATLDVAQKAKEFESHRAKMAGYSNLRVPYTIGGRTWGTTWYEYTLSDDCKLSYTHVIVSRPQDPVIRDQYIADLRRVGATRIDNQNYGSNWAVWILPSKNGGVSGISKSKGGTFASISAEAWLGWFDNREAASKFSSDFGRLVAFCASK